jgi:hypothetical protein
MCRRPPSFGLFNYKRSLLVSRAQWRPSDAISVIKDCEAAFAWMDNIIICSRVQLYLGRILFRAEFINVIREEDPLFFFQLAKAFKSYRRIPE